MCKVDGTPGMILRSNPISFDCRFDIHLKDLLLDVYVPAGAVPATLPGLVLMSGAPTKRSSNGTEHHYEATTLAAQGYVVIAIDYRRLEDSPPGDPFVASILDAAAAFNWLRDNAEEWNVDPDRIGFFGESAGAIAELFAGLIGDAEGGRIADVTAIVDIAGLMFGLE
ncbi:MAG: alpha/beta hydrolase [Gammaproteobacteria bacterium]|nr:alpha/beta hydrolase [Gammaproteobacteria bacterium]